MKGFDGITIAVPTPQLSAPAGVAFETTAGAKFVPEAQASGIAKTSTQNPTGEEEQVAIRLETLVTDTKVDDAFETLATGFSSQTTEAHAEKAPDKTDQASVSLENPVLSEERLARLESQMANVQQVADALKESVSITPEVIKVLPVIIEMLPALQYLLQKAIAEEQDQKKKESLISILLKLFALIPLMMSKEMLNATVGQEVL